MKVPALSKTYADRTVLCTPEFELEAGKTYAVIGSNGSGKSTLARILAGVIHSDNRATLRGIPTGYMPQKSYAFRMSTRSNILLGGRDAERCSHLIQALRLDALAKKPAHRLSGGETARMALARLLMSDYELLILDEPTAAMDMESTLLAEALLKEYCNHTGCAVFWVTHSLQQARRTADMAIFLKDGELVEFGPAVQVLQSPTDERTRRFIQYYG